MAGGLETLTTPLIVPLTDQHFASRLGEALTNLTRLLIVREIQEDESGAALHFLPGGQGRLASHDANYSIYLELARRSQERQHPVGVTFGEGSAILELIRADNDVPVQLWEEEPDRVHVLFQGHDGVFHVKSDHPDSGRLRTLIGEAIRRQARIWFIVEKPDLALLDVQAAGWVVNISISFVVAPDHLLKTADVILRSRIRSTKALCRDIRAVAKAYIDEADELKRAVREIQNKAARIQIDSLSPKDTIEKAKRLRTVPLANKEMQEKIRAVANSYVLIAEKNHQLFDEFKEKYHDILPPTNSAE
jgi:hypothetical protein